MAWCSISRRDHGIRRPEVGAAPGIRDEVYCLGGVLGEHDLVGGRADEIGNFCPRRLVEVGRFLGDLVHTPVDVGIVRRVVMVHRFDHSQGLLGGRGGIQVHEPIPVDDTLEDREVLLDAGDIQVRRPRAYRHAS